MQHLTTLLWLMLLAPSCSQFINPSQNCNPQNGEKFCNAELKTNVRVKDLVSKMTLDEKIAILSSNDGVKRLNIKPIPWGEGLHGVVSHCYNESYCPTSFPHALMLASSFNRSLWFEIGNSIGKEARALNNLGTIDEIGSAPFSPLMLWAPNGNPFRDPRWGRGHETPGEDPFVCGEFVSEYAKGLQKKVGGFVKAVSMLKHAVAYDSEGNQDGTIDRGEFDAVVRKQDLTNYYMFPFKSAIVEGNIKGMMCSYNSLNGIPSCMNNNFLNKQARDSWGFKGVVVSDCDAIGDLASTRYIEKFFNGSVNEQSNQALIGGCDFNCGIFWAKNLKSSVVSNVTLESDIDVAVERIFTLVMELGLFNNVSEVKLANYGLEYLNHSALALEASVQSIVLLQNRKSILPITNKKTRLAVIGPMSNVTTDMLSNYKGDNMVSNTHSPLQSLRRIGNVVSHSFGSLLWGNDTSLFQEACDAAKIADVAIVFVGLHPQWFDSPKDGDAMEGEGIDRKNVTLSPIQLQLVQAVVATSTPVIVVFINGGIVSSSWIKNNVDTILEAFYPGEMGGDAVASLLFGEASPSGRLPYSYYDEDFTLRRSNIQDMNLTTSGGITYQYYTGNYLWPFGFGLTYSSFSFHFQNDMDLNIFTTIKNLVSNPIIYKINVRNTGKVASSLSILAFITAINTDGTNHPIKELVSFCRVNEIMPAEVKSCELLLSTSVIEHSDENGQSLIYPGSYKVSIGDPSFPDEVLVSFLEIKEYSSVNNNNVIVE